MFPKAGLNNLYYPMTADIYYATESQNDFGEIIKEWDKDRSISCSAIKRSPDTRIPNLVESQKFLEYDIQVSMRTSEDILRSTSDISYTITDILVKDIKDAGGNLVWKESSDESTVFEIRAVEPILDMFSIVSGYRIYLVRADSQVI
jgi:hypothetical protein